MMMMMLMMLLDHVAVGHAGHSHFDGVDKTPVRRRLSSTSLPSLVDLTQNAEEPQDIEPHDITDQTLFSLEEQIEHKVAFIEGHLSAAPMRFVLIGHSVGSFISLKVGLEILL